jgi:primary-amine oxidase
LATGSGIEPSDDRLELNGSRRSIRIRDVTEKSSQRIARLAALAVVMLGMDGMFGHGAAAHPLDPLSGDEIASTISVLRAADLVDSATRFPLIDLDEPPKASVLAWQPGQTLGRAAFVVARRDRTAYEGVVDLAAHKVARWQALPGIQPSILVEEWELAQRIATADPGWRAAMRKRGYTAFDELFCAPFSAGYFGDPLDEGRRLLKVVCYDTAGGRTDVWSRPIEGLHAVVDLDARQVIRVVDTGAVPISRAVYDVGRPLTAVSTPVAPHRTFALEGNAVRWKNWSFHLRLDRRAGPILSLVRYTDRARDRLVLYRGSIAELFVPYMDPDSNWAFRTYMDVGEYGFGLLSSPLAPGIDCPADATFLDAVLPDDTGAPVTVGARICLFERDTGGPLWRHAEIVNQTYAGRPAVELVARSIAAVGNYDYVVDWVLTEAGVIRLDVGATGILEVKGVAARGMADPSAPADTASGTLVAPHLSAINHDHFLSFRLDVDIDGPANTLVRRRLVPERLTGDGRRSLWRVADEAVRAEGALAGVAHGAAELWRIVNPNLTNRLGQPPGYELRAGHAATSLLAADDHPQRRAGFSAAPLWITAYDPRELYAAGAYPNQSPGGDGLPAYVVQQRPVADADLVLWYTMGFHHVPRPEDWPVMPTMWHSVALVPDGFFDSNPGLELPRDSPGAQ